MVVVVNGVVSDGLSLFYFFFVFFFLTLRRYCMSIALATVGFLVLLSCIFVLEVGVSNVFCLMSIA